LLTLLSAIASVPPLGVQLTAVVCWLGIVGLVAEGLNRYTKTGPEVTRKVVHIGVGNVILLAWWLHIPAWVGITASILFSGVALLSYRIPLLPSINSVGRNSLGTFFYAVSIGVLISCFWPLQQPHYAVLGILVMTWGDGFAAIVGQNFGRHPYELWGMKKSWEGSLAMAIVTLIVSGILLWAVQGNWVQSWSVALVVAAIATGLEAFSRLGIDNLTVPVGSAAAAFVLNQWLWTALMH
jgi:phytol kinase